MQSGTNGRGKQSLTEALDIAIDAVNRGEYKKGKAALTWILEQDPGHATAWLWMACCVTDDRAKDECYRRAGESQSNGKSH